jgi:hypothetical protein
MERAALLKAFRNGGIYEMIYQSDKGKWSKRRVRILTVTGNYFKAFCYVKKSQRFFKIDNVFAILPVNK